MCGICGVKTKNNNLNFFVNKSEFNNFNRNLFHRGPDSQDTLFVENISFGSTRLKILDLNDRSNMPMRDENYILLFNGEIYNYKILRKNLEAQGEKFKTKSDTEVVLKLFKIFKLKSFNMLEGMFSIAIYDINEKKIFLTRDVFGIKPLFFFIDHKKLIFSSEEDHIAKFLNDHRYSKFAIYSYLKKGSVLQPFTKYENIKSVLPGQILIIDSQNKLKTQFYNTVKDIIVNAENSEKIFKEDELIDLLKNEIQSNLISDVKSSLMLSSGIDSLFIHDQTNKSLNTFTLSSLKYKNSNFDEINILKNKGIEITDYKYLGDDEIDNEEINKIFKEKLSLDGKQYYLLSKIIAKNNIKVSLTGIGGDEMLNSYPSFSKIPKINNFIKYFPPFIKNLNVKSYYINKIIRLFSSKSLSEIYLEYRSSFSEKEIAKILNHNFEIGYFREKILENFNQNLIGIKSIQNKIKSLELNIYLRDQVLKEVDYASMLNSVECRVPYLSKKILFYTSLMSARGNLSKDILIKKSSVYANQKYNKLPFLVENLQKKKLKNEMTKKIKNMIN